MRREYLRFGEILLKNGVVTPSQIEKALEAQKESPGQLIGQILMELGAITEKDVAATLGQQMNIPYASLESGLLKPAAEQNLNKLLPEETARKHRVLPLYRHENSLTVAIADPTDIVVLDNLRKITGCHITRIIATPSDIQTGIDGFYGEGGMLQSAVEASYDAPVAVVEEGADEPLSLDSLVASAGKTPVIKLTDLLIRQAIKERASDIHIEPFPGRLNLRFRIDGVLHEVPAPDKSMQLPLISRLKILSRMDIAEKRLPQDASFRATIENRTVDFRVSTIPTVHGEKMVLRILDREAVSLNLGTLGFEAHELKQFRGVIRKPYGLILITGPTGSGKTTTLYAALNDIKSSGQNILTVEDPVEYQLEGVNQVQVKPQIGLTFASGLRAFLRQDPDIILVGEIRDAETAQVCIRAAMTGHLVFSTLHTNDACSTLNRLIDIGIEPFFVSNSLLMIVAQRLVRRLCQKCKQSYEPSASQLPKLLQVEKKTLYKTKGCDHCSHTGYRGRTAIYEIMVINERIQELVTQRASLVHIRAEARKAGMKTLEESGYQKVIEGETSLEEIFRVTLSGGYETA
ncbi:MAG: hypothetical protein A3C47_03885 [Omnitrophica bacterium RIFCSPHIGHO2_02_FULL_51_18]|nr:MAG: hypothetical protein A3C47_03885 [Omnitrophica bacterium RIFCSPHIGHO2_02_FULL_51_18]